MHYKIKASKPIHQIITATENLTKSTKLNKDIKATVQEMLDKDIKDAY